MRKTMIGAAGWISGRFNRRSTGSEPVGRRWPWAAFLTLGSILLLIPLVGPLVQVILPAGQAWPHLSETVLAGYLWTTLVLAVTVVPLAGIVGTLSAWIISRYDLPARWLFDLMLILPLAMPSYITAYAYAGIFNYFGPVQNALVALGFSREVASQISISNLPGLIAVLTVSLYPYVYLILRARFRRGLTAPLEAARSLGAGGFSQFFRIALPMSRPALAGAMGIVLMEVLGEYGAVVYYGEDTLTTGVFKAWFGFYDLASARRLGGYVILIVLAVLGIEQALRRNRQFSSSQMRREELELMSASSLGKLGLGLVAGLPGVLGFIIPIMQLSTWAAGQMNRTNWVLTLSGLGNTLGLALVTGLIALLLGVLIGYAHRMVKVGPVRKLSDLSLLGHSIPGAVISLGVLSVSGWLGSILGINPAGPMALVLLVYAYLVRFLAVSQRPLSAALEYNGTTMDEASRSLGKPPVKTLILVHLPNLGGPAAAALALIFLDIIKELPLTIILRPFNFNTLAVRAYELAANEMVAEAAIPSLLLVVIGAVGILMLRRRLV